MQGSHLGLRPVMPDSIASFLVGQSLDERIASRRDNFLWLRLSAASLVVFGHSFPLADPVSWPRDPLRHLVPGLPSHILGLMVFFVVSGFLIPLSFERRPELLRFLRARFLRIWPGFFVCLLVTAFGIGVAMTTLPLQSYFSTAPAISPYRYVVVGASIFWPPTFLPGVFQTNPIPNAVNCPLWTIAVEARLYLVVAAVGLLRAIRFPRVAAIAVAGVALWLLADARAYGGSDYAFRLDRIVEITFAFGSLAYLLRDRLRISSGILALLVGITFLLRATPLAMPSVLIAVAYGVLWFAYVPRFPAMPFGTDLSYGLYLYAWPVQQSIVALAAPRPETLIVIEFPVLFVVSLLSWRFVEKPALSLKDRGWRKEKQGEARRGRCGQLGAAPVQAVVVGPTAKAGELQA